MADTYKQPPKPDEQIGGTHYSRLGIEPIQFIETNGLGYHEGNIIKYVSRWRNKNGIEDLKKAKWYIERLLELEETSQANARESLDQHVVDSLMEFGPCHKEEVTDKEQVLFDAVGWFQSQKGLLATPVYYDNGEPCGVNVYDDTEEPTFYTNGQCMWYQHKYRTECKG